MKNINIKSFLLLAGVLCMTACSENAWNDKLDGFKEPPVYDKTETVEYTLTAADYKTIASNSTNKSLAEAAGESKLLAAIGNNGYFPSSEAARKYLPAFVADSKFPYFTLNNGSTVRMTYNLDNGLNKEVVAINNGVKNYTVSEADYQKAWGSEEDFINGFAPITPASASLAGILKAQYPDAENGDYAVISYAEASTNPIFGTGEAKEPTVYIDQPFADNMDGFTIENVLLPEGSTYVWSLDSRGYMKASGYVGGKNLDSEGWLISDALELATDANAILTFDQAANYFNDADQVARETTVNIREKGGQWVNLSIADRPSGNNWNWVASGEIDLSAYNGKTVQIGFCYKSTTTKAGTWEVKNVKLIDGSATRTAATRGAMSPVPVENKVAIYKYDGSAWKVPGSMIILQPADYTAMGQSYGNLSGTLPEQLLPTYLANALPYASEDATEFVVYKYYDSNKVTSFKASEYTKTGGVWVYNNGVAPLTEKFTRKNNKWEFNPSVELVLPYARNTDPSYTYYMAVKDWVFANVTKKLYPDSEPANGSQPGPAFIDYRDNAEFWSGASAYYGNVDVRASTAKTNAPEGYTGYDGLSDDEISALILKRFATESFPGALSIVDSNAQLVDGMDVTYTFTFTAYTSDGTQEYVVEYLLVGKGTFQFTALWKLNDGTREKVNL